MAFSDSVDVFVLKKEQGRHWSACRLRFSLANNTSKTRKACAENAEKILDGLVKAGISESKGMTKNEIRRYSDGELVVVEIASKASYRRFSSQCNLAYKQENGSPAVKEANTYIAYLFDVLPFDR